MSDSAERWERLLGEYLAWLKGVRNLSPHTIRAYRGDLEAFGTWCASEGIDPLTSPARRLRGYLSYLVRARYKDRTINRRLSALRKFYEWLERRGEVPSAAFASVPGRAQKKELPRTMNDEQLARLIASCDTSSAEGMRDAAFVETLYATGARISEVSALTIGDVDTAVGQARLFGKGRKQRIVPLYDRAVEALVAYTNGPRHALVARRKRGEPVDALFVSTRGNAMSADALRREFKRLMSVAGLDSSLGPHSVRHTYATELLSGGADLKTVQELLGHESLATTQIYTHLSVDRLKLATRQAHPRA